jgi:hypothetical protein
MACQTDRNDDWRVMTHRLPKLKPPPPPPRSWADALRDCLPGRHNAAVVPVDIADGFATIHVHADGRGCVLAPRVSRRWVHVANRAVQGLKMALERGTTPKRSRHAFSPRYGLQSWLRGIGGRRLSTGAAGPRNPIDEGGRLSPWGGATGTAQVAAGGGCRRCCTLMGTQTHRPHSASFAAPLQRHHGHRVSALLRAVRPPSTLAVQVVEWERQHTPAQDATTAAFVFCTPQLSRRQYGGIEFTSFH